LREMIAVCGLNCYQCGAFLAAKENDDQGRAEVAQGWSRLFEVEIKPVGGDFSITATSVKLESAGKRRVI